MAYPHSMYPFRTANGKQYAVFFDGIVLKRMLTQTADGVEAGTIDVPYVLGTPVTTVDRWSWALAKNYLHGFNGTDKKMLDQDGIFRDIGLGLLPDSTSVTVSQGSNDPEGIPASSVGGAQPGYQFYACLYNRFTGDVGSRIKIGSRVANNTASFIDISGLPNTATLSPEYDILLGRTGDGAEVPYVIIDSTGAFVFVQAGITSYTVRAKNIDGRYELPSRNDQPPALKQVWRCGDRFYGFVEDSPYIRYTESEAATAQNGQYGYLGNSFHSWPADNLETFPTGENVICGAEDGGVSWCFSHANMAILVDQSGIFGWQGPWEGGIAGIEAFTKSKHGPHWISDKKQLCTMSADGPVSVSEEYEAALLAKIGDAYLDQVQVKAYCNPAKNRDVILIKALDSDGNPFCVVHDFGIGGQGYEAVYADILGGDFYLAIIPGSDGRRVPWAAASDGNIYELDNGDTDNGVEYSADAIGLLNLGPNKPVYESIEWFGDKGVTWSVAKPLNSTIGQFESLDTKIVEDDDSQCKVEIPGGDGKFLYYRVQLTSHSTDGSLDLNDPPHVPVETYGRVHMVAPLKRAGSERGH